MENLKEKLKSKTFLKASAFCGIIAVILDAIAIIVLAANNPDYNHIEQVISELGAVDSPTHILGSLNFLIYGILICIFALGLYSGVHGDNKVWIGPLLLIIFAVFDGVGSAVFPCDSGCEPITFTGTMHYVIAVVSTPAMIFAPFAFTKHFKTDENWKEYYPSFSLIIGIFTAIFSILMILIFFQEEIFGEVFLAIDGLIQRVVYTVYNIWIIVLAVKLLRIAGET